MTTDQAVAQSTVVLDTNVVLDLWFFEDPHVATLRQAVERGDLVWVVTPAIRDEVTYVLSHGSAIYASRVCANKQVALEALDRLAKLSEPPAPGVHQGLRCTDADDQKFIDLALSLAPCWLLSRDRAVLKLARRAAGHGVRIDTPAQWLVATTGAA